MRLSHSKLSCILNCPMTYYLNYIQGIHLKTPKSSLAIGSAVHWGIEHNTEDLSEYFKENGGFKSRDNYDREQLLPEAMIHGYFKHKDEMFKQILTDPNDGSDLELLEETHEVFMNGNLKSNIIKEGHNFVGIIDLLLLTNKGFIIIDYKTSTYTPDWNNYKDQLYRYIFELKTNFPDVPIIKIGIINIRKTAIRQKKNENESEFLQRLKFEYEINDENYINYHEFLVDDIDDILITNYINNLSIMADLAQTIEDKKLYFINYATTVSQYGKSDYYDIFYHTPQAEVLYNIDDYIFDEDINDFVNIRDCVDIDMKVIDYSNILNKYTLFEQELLQTSAQSKEEFFNELSKKYIINNELLEIYWTTYIKKKEVK